MATRRTAACRHRRSWRRHAIPPLAVAALLWLSLPTAAADRREEEQNKRTAALSVDGAWAFAEANAAKMSRIAGHASFIPGLGALRDGWKLMTGCACLYGLYKMYEMIDCGSKKCDCRRCKCCAKLLMNSGYDEFEAFKVIVTVHHVSGITKSGMTGEKEFKVTVKWRWSRFETSGTKDLRWEQTKGMDVPQGAGECVITLLQVGIVKNKQVAELVLETKPDMLDKGDEFFGRKQKLKLESDGSYVGTLHMTFRRPGDGEVEGNFPVDGVDEDSALAVEILKSKEELESTPGFVKPEDGKYKGPMKMKVVAKCLEGPLREINPKGKELGVFFIRVISCNCAELSGDDMRSEFKKQEEKAKAKGLSELQKKWYWVWYADKKDAWDMSKWHYPEGFMPLTAITAVHRSPERQDQFIVKFGSKQTIIYRREGGKGLDVWVEGLDIVYSAAREEVMQAKEAEDKKEKALARMRYENQAYVRDNGAPKSQPEWEAWFKYWKEKNYEEEMIKQLSREMTEGGSPSKPKGRKN